MKIYRFIDGDGHTRFGYDYHDNCCKLFEGDLLTGLHPTQLIEDVKQLLSPIEPTAILCIGANYKEHVLEFGKELPTEPVLFMKNPAALNHPDSPIVLPKHMVEQPQADYEVELVVVIGKDAKRVSVDRALDYVLGYTVGNDVSARRIQRNGGAGQWVKGKSPDTFCPLGPCIVTTDELTDPQSMTIECRLNNQVMQSGHTSDMIFPVAELISQLSQDMTLKAGTVMLTGTPSGVGDARKPPIHLKPGDVLESTIENIGTLSNHVVGE